MRTGDPRLPRARAIAVAGDRIAGGVDVREGDRSAVSSERVDLEGRCVTPGFHDAHVHFLEWALAREQPDLSARGEPRRRVRTCFARAARATGGCSRTRWATSSPRRSSRRRSRSRAGGRPVARRDARPPHDRRDGLDRRPGGPPARARGLRPLGVRSLADRGGARRGRARGVREAYRRGRHGRPRLPARRRASPRGSGWPPTGGSRFASGRRCPPSGSTRRSTSSCAPGSATTGCGSARSRRSPTARSARAPRRCSRRSATAARACACSSARSSRTHRAREPRRARRGRARHRRRRQPARARRLRGHARALGAGGPAAAHRARAAARPRRRRAASPALGVTASVQPSHAPSDRAVAAARLGRALRAAPTRTARWRDGRRRAVLRLGRADRAGRAAGRRAGGGPRLAGLRGAGRPRALAGFWTGAAHARHAERDARPPLPGTAADLVVLERDPDVLSGRGARSHRGGRDHGGRPLGARAAAVVRIVVTRALPEAGLELLRGTRRRLGQPGPRPLTGQELHEAAAARRRSSRCRPTLSTAACSTRPARS